MKLKVNCPSSTPSGPPSADKNYGWNLKALHYMKGGEYHDIQPHTKSYFDGIFSNLDDFLDRSDIQFCSPKSRPAFPVALSALLDSHPGQPRDHAAPAFGCGGFAFV